MSTHPEVHGDAHAAAVSAGYEKVDPRAQPIIVFTVLLAVTLVATFYAMKWTNDAFMAGEEGKDTGAHPLAAVRTEPPAPRLQPQPSLEWNAFKAEQVHAVESYRWIDRTNGVVQLPLERALDLVTERGLPHRK